VADSGQPRPHFSTTHWSLILRAGSEQPSSREALAALCQRYWFPIYAFIRRAGHHEHDAQDLTQGFFTRFLEKDYLHDVDRQRGRFRSFLLASVGHFLANARDHARAAKRGGGKAPLSLDFARAEERYGAEPAGQWTPEKLYHRRWALELLQAVLERLQREWATPERQEFFRLAQDHLTGASPAAPLADIARACGMTEGAVKTAVHRLRRRYRALLREEIGHTVAAPDEIDEELRQLFAALQGM
jgi:DNA-directed RNA polymerase specialized sigma24 family protein